MADGSVKIEVLLDDSKVSGGVRKVEGRLSGIASTAKRGIVTVGKLAGALGLVGLAYKGIDMVKNSLDGAIDRYDTLNNFPRVMAQIGFDAETSQKAINKLSDGIQGLPTRLDEVAATAQSIAIMTGDLDLAVDTTLALNNAFLASGASAQDAKRGLDQYVQMLAKGEVDLQSWRTLQETMPYALRKTAEAFGFTGESATNDFYEALKSGEITMAEFNAKLIELDQAQGGFAETARTASAGIKTAWTNMKTWFVMGVADILGAIDDALGGVGSIEGAINGLKPIVQGAFGWIADVAIPAVAEGVRWLIDRFNEFKPTLESVKNAFQPLVDVLMQTAGNIKEQIVPFVQTMIDVFYNLLPVLKLVGTVVGTSLLVTIIAATSVLNALYNAVIPIINAFWDLANMVVNAVNLIIAILTLDFDAALQYWNNMVESAVSFFKNLWDGVVGFVKGFVNAIIGWFKTLYNVLVGNSIIPDLVNGIIKWFQNLLKSAINLAKNIVNNVINWFKNLFNNAKNIFNNLRSTIQNIWNNIKNTISNVVSGIRNTISNIFNSIRNTVTNIVNRIKSTISNVFNSLRSIVSNAFNKVSSAVRTGINNAYNAVKNKIKDFYNAGRNIVTSIANGIKSAIGKVTSAISNVAKKVRDFLPFSPAKEGPLRDIMDVKIAESIAEAIRKGRNSAVKEMDKLASDLFETAQPKHDLLANIRGYTANSVLSSLLPTSFAVQQEIIHKQANAGRYDDSRVIQLLKQLVEKDGNVYIDRERVGSILDEEQARRIRLLEGWVAID